MLCYVSYVKEFEILRNNQTMVTHTSTTHPEDSAIRPDGQQPSPGPFAVGKPPNPLDLTYPPVTDQLSCDNTQPPSPNNYVTPITQALQSGLLLGRLPLPEPMTFNCGPLTYTEWRAAFMTLINNKGTTQQKKFSYNQALLSRVGFDYPRHFCSAIWFTVPNQTKITDQQNQSINQSINQSNFFSADIPGVARLRGATTRSVFKCEVVEVVP